MKIIFLVEAFSISRNCSSLFLAPTKQKEKKKMTICFLLFTLGNAWLMKGNSDCSWGRDSTAIAKDEKGNNFDNFSYRQSHPLIIILFLELKKIVLLSQTFFRLQFFSTTKCTRTINSDELKYNFCNTVCHSRTDVSTKLNWRWKNWKNIYSKREGGREVMGGEKWYVYVFVCCIRGICTCLLYKR